MISFVIFFGILGFHSNASPLEREIVYLPQLNSTSVRLSYISEVLDAALQKTVKEFGKYEILLSRKPTSNAKIADDLLSNEYNYSVGWISNIKEPPAGLIFIPIPLYRGVLGARIFHTKITFQKELSRIKSIDELKKIPIGVGENWGDDKIMQNSGLSVALGNSHADLTKMLFDGKIKLVTRSIYEAHAELADILPVYPDIAVEKNILLYYQSDLFLAFSQKNIKLKGRIEKGLRQILANGEFEKIFNKYFKKSIDAAEVSSRLVFKINTPYIIPGEYLSDKKLWIDLKRKNND